MIGRLLLGGAAALAGLRFFSARAVRRADERPPAGAFVTVEGVRLHYLDRGAGAPVVLLHGSGLALQDFVGPIFDQLARDYRVIAFDRPGFGASGHAAAEPLTLEQNVRLLREALSALQVERPLLVGHSTGGSVALRYALAAPDAVAGLVLLAPSAYASGLAVPALFAVAHVPVLRGLSRQLFWPALVDIAAPQFAAALCAPNRPPTGYAQRLRAMAVRPAQFSAWADELRHLRAGLRAQHTRYRSIHVPVVVVFGAADSVEPPGKQVYRLRRALPQARLVKLPHTGHAIHQVRPEAVWEAVRSVHRVTHPRWRQIWACLPFANRACS